jgi:hypothetical protein
VPEVLMDVLSRNGASPAPVGPKVHA